MTSFICRLLPFAQFVILVFFLFEIYIYLYLYIYLYIFIYYIIYYILYYIYIYIYIYIGSIKDSNQHM